GPADRRPRGPAVSVAGAARALAQGLPHVVAFRVEQQAHTLDGEDFHHLRAGVEGIAAGDAGIARRPDEARRPDLYVRHESFPHRGGGPPLPGGLAPPVLVVHRHYRLPEAVPRAAKSRWSCSGSTGFTRCTSKPAARARSRSSGWP